MVSLLALPHHDTRVPLPVSSPLSQDLDSVCFRRRFGHRIDTGSVYRPRPITTYSILLSRAPCFDLDLYHYHQLAPGLAPQPQALDANRAGVLSWETFARRYWSDLSAFPYLLTRARRQMAMILSRYASVTLLGMELPQVPEEEAFVRCVRRLVHGWLMGATPIEVI